MASAKVSPKKKKKQQSSNPLRKRLFMLAVLGGAMVLAVGMTQYRQELRSKADVASQANCTVTDKLVNPCRPWLGAYANGYPGHTSTGMRDQLEDHEKRIGKQVDILHYYHTIGSLPLNADEKYFINRPNTYVLLNWKPAAKWADAAGGNASMNAHIDKAADSIKSVAPKKIMLAIHHEPENDLSSGVSCAKLKGSAGSPADYVNMWHNVRKRFDAKGVNNVVWAYIITGYKGWFCTLDALYPGDSYVDWIMFDIYGGGNNDPFDQSAKEIYDYLTQNSNSKHNYLSKPWGIGETSVFNADPQYENKYWDDAKAAVESNKYPNIKLWMVFDSKNSDGDFRIGYNKNGGANPTETAHYKAFAHSKAFSGTTTQVTPAPTSSTTVAPTTGDTLTPTVGFSPTPTFTIATPTLYCLGACPTDDPLISITPPVDLTPPTQPDAIKDVVRLFLELVKAILEFLFGIQPAPAPDPNIPNPDDLSPTPDPIDVTLTPGDITPTEVPTETPTP